MYDEILQAIINMAEQAIGAPIVTGSMPPDNGVAMTGQSAPASIMLDIGTNERMTVICNGKNTDQQTVIRQLDSIHRFLTHRMDFPTGDEWQVYAIETIASPRLLGREQNSQWLYASTLLVKINTKGIKRI
jgi:hypothetical protein